MPGHAISAQLNTKGNIKVEVLSCIYELRRSVDNKGRPSSITQGGTINIEVLSTRDTNDYIKWITDPFMVLDGTIEFYDPEFQLIKTVSYENARCTGYIERFDKIPNPQNFDRPAFALTLTINAEKITIAGAQFTNNWDDKR